MNDKDIEDRFKEIEFKLECLVVAQELTNSSITNINENIKLLNDRMNFNNLKGKQ